MKCMSDDCKNKGIRILESKKAKVVNKKLF